MAWRDAELVSPTEASKDTLAEAITSNYLLLSFFPISKEIEPLLES